MTQRIFWLAVISLAFLLAPVLAQEEQARREAITLAAIYEIVQGHEETLNDLQHRLQRLEKRHRREE